MGAWTELDSGRSYSRRSLRVSLSPRVSYGMWAVPLWARASIDQCAALRINHPSPTISFPLFSHCTGQSQPSCPLSLPHQPPIPTLPPFSTLLWKNTTIRLSKTSPSIPSFPGFNPVNPPRQSSPSFESKPPSSINHRIAAMDSRIG